MSYMNYVNRSVLTDNTRQVLSSFDWDGDFIFPSTYAPYHPSIELIKQRLLSVDGLEGVPATNIMTYKLRGYTFQQAGITEVEPRDVTFKFQDFEDQSIHTWLLDWRSKENSWRNRFSYRKEDIYIDYDFYQLNSSRQAVGKWECRTGLLENVSMPESGKEDKNPLGEITATVQFEYTEFIPLNV